MGTAAHMRRTVDMPDVQQRAAGIDVLKPVPSRILEEWSNSTSDHDEVDMSNGAFMTSHVDQLDFGVSSDLVLIDERTREEWRGRARNPHGKPSSSPLNPRNASGSASGAPNSRGRAETVLKLIVARQRGTYHQVASSPSSPWPSLASLHRRKVSFSDASFLRPRSRSRSRSHSNLLVQSHLRSLERQNSAHRQGDSPHMYVMEPQSQSDSSKSHNRTVSIGSIPAASPWMANWLDPWGWGGNTPNAPENETWHLRDASPVIRQPKRHRSELSLSHLIPPLKTDLSASFFADLDPEFDSPSLDFYPQTTPLLDHAGSSSDNRMSRQNSAALFDESIPLPPLGGSSPYHSAVQSPARLLRHAPADSRTHSPIADSRLWPRGSHVRTNSATSSMRTDLHGPSTPSRTHGSLSPRQPTPPTIPPMSAPEPESRGRRDSFLALQLGSPTPHMERSATQPLRQSPVSTEMTKSASGLGIVGFDNEAESFWRN